MLPQAQSGHRDLTAMLGELHPFLAQLGSADGLVTLGALSTSLRVPRVESLAALRHFLEAYRARVLVALELPTIDRACQHASRNESRELLALDQALARKRLLKPFAAASRRVGCSQLAKLRPLRDERVVQRYLHAVEAGQAHGWHTVVFGVTLALYSLPVRQGLLTYARQTLTGFLRAAAHPLHLTQDECLDLQSHLCAGLPKHLEKIVSGNGARREK
jgi:urease accessory protein UreF